ncbi:hypothetical protein NMY22_g10883 [Coprinellus aureogranulatus]|nr:hypothetical protein NMY22_g10883 [Coprinellus aureogranulatus]
MASANTSWMPAKGRHRVEIGSSLARCLKKNKLNNGEASTTTTSKRAHLPDKDFYSFRYSHKPPSLDTKKQGMIRFDQGATYPILLEHPSVQPGESVMYRGTENTKLKDVDCVLIIDEDTGTFTLEKLEASVHLKFERGLPSIMSRTASPTPSTSTPRGSSKEYTRDEIDRDILNLVDDDLPTTKRAKRSPHRKEEEEEEEDEESFPCA